MSGSHKRGKTKGDFCATAVSGGKCTHKGGAPGNDYRKIGKPKWPGKKKPSQAHHLLPVTCITSTIMSVAEIRGVIRETVWCINDADNMYGMPIWGGTVKYYCNISLLTALAKAQKKGAPGWANIPQHLQDHDLYNIEVSDYLGQPAAEWQEQGHQVKPEDIRSELLTWSDLMKQFLEERGQRNGGTHACWQGASDNQGDYPGWYEPFSMADTPREQSFPLRVQKAADSWVKWYKRVKG